MTILIPDPWATVLAGSKAAGTAITVKQYARFHEAKDGRKIAGYDPFAVYRALTVLDSPKRSGHRCYAGPKYAADLNPKRRTHQQKQENLIVTEMPVSAAAIIDKRARTSAQRVPKWRESFRRS